MLKRLDLALLRHHLNHYHPGIQISCRTDCQNTTIPRNRHTRPQQVPVVSFIHIRSIMDPTSPIMSVHSHTFPCPLWLSQVTRTTTRPPRASSIRDPNKSLSAKLNPAFLDAVPAVYTDKPRTVCRIGQNSTVSVLLLSPLTTTPFHSVFVVVIVAVWCLSIDQSALSTVPHEDKRT